MGEEKGKAVLVFNVTNKGMSDQIHDNIMIRIDNTNLQVDKSAKGESGDQAENSKELQNLV